LFPESRAAFSDWRPHLTAAFSAGTRLTGVSKALIGVGTVFALLGVVLIPLPGPGVPIVGLGVVLFMVGVARDRKTRSR
jgi:hypothetical protein